MPVSADTLRLLMSKGLQGDDLLEVVEAFDREQANAAKPRSANAIRQARFREKHKAVEAESVTSNVTDNVTERNAGGEKEMSPTPPERKNPPSKENPPKGGQKKGSRLPDGWRPNEADYAESCRVIGRQRTEAELAKFRDHFIAVPGEKGRKLDWDSTFRNWIRRIADNFGKGAPVTLFDGKPAPATGPEPLPDEAILKFLRNFARSDNWPGGLVYDRIGPPPGKPGCRIPPHLLAEYERMRAEENERLAG